MMEESLISEVENRPILYDRSLDSYKKLNAREKAWKEVAKILGMQEFECRRRWRTLRDSFIKLYRATKYCNIFDGVRKKQWIYYKQMSFLIPHIEQKPNYENFSEQDRSESGNEEPLLEEYKYQGYQPQEISSLSPNDTLLLLNDVATVPTSAAEASGAKKRKRTSDPHYRKFMETSRDDPDTQFLLSCAPTLKRLDDRQNAIARMKILQVLYELEFESNDYGRPPSSASLHSINSQDDSKDWSSLLTPLTVVEDGKDESIKD